MTWVVVVGAIAAGGCESEDPETPEVSAAVAATERFVGSAAIIGALGAPLASRDALVDDWGQDLVARLVTDEACGVLTWEQALVGSVDFDACTSGRFGIGLSGTVGFELEASPVRLMMWLDDVRTADYAIQGWAALFARDFDRGEFMLEGSVAITHDGAKTWMSLFDLDLVVSETAVELSGAGYRESVADAAHFGIDRLRWEAGDCVPREGSLEFPDASVTFASATPADGRVAVAVDGAQTDAFVQAPCP